MIDRKVFFDKVRAAPFGGSLSNGQVEGLLAILDEWDKSQIQDLRFLAYMLATVFHETAQTMQPIREMGSEAYLKAKPYYPWVGEGLVQVTWESNARKFGATAPGQLMSWPLCLRPLFDGMTRGMFTGKRLADYFNASTNDPVNARRVINGIDRANLIAHYYGQFLAAITFVATPSVAPTASIPVPATPQPQKPTIAPTPQKPASKAPIGLLQAIINIFILLFQRKATP